MSYWWVNHKQTFRAEVEGGYIWSPTQTRDGKRNQTYVNLTLTAPGDVVFSFASGQIAAIGTVIEHHREQGKPEEFGKAGDAWEQMGWAVPVSWIRLPVPIKPKQHLDKIAPLLPQRLSPIQANGNGNQFCYLARISDELGDLILGLADPGEIAAVSVIRDCQHSLAEEAAIEAVSNTDIEPTMKEQVVQSRIGQGKFRARLEEIESACRVTGETNPALLIASHIKPWRDCSNEERLDGNNGLLLAPHIDKLFDKGWISFSDSGDLLCYELGAQKPLVRWGVVLPINVGRFRPKQCQYLEYHREHVFKGESTGKST